ALTSAAPRLGRSVRDPQIDAAPSMAAWIKAAQPARAAERRFSTMPLDCGSLAWKKSEANPYWLAGAASARWITKYSPRDHTAVRRPRRFSLRHALFTATVTHLLSTCRLF